MGKINVLDRHTAELIAAGEVVERPSSVVKELLENSIDAGSTAITVEIKNGGIKYIRITDNGQGFLREDVPKAFLRHATSKVKTQNDLDKIMTLGFRGEALASVSAVANVELLTCETHEDIGTRYVISGGIEQVYEEIGCPKGSTIMVRDMFYNVPARMKFLKKDVTEANAIASVLDKLALSHPQIAFTFIRDGKQTLKTIGDGKSLSAIYCVYGREFAKDLLQVDYDLNGIKVDGYVSKPQNARPNRNMQDFFINGRFVKSKTAFAAIEQAFKNTLMVSKFPACVLYLKMDESLLDVNVHPAKTEVRFVNEKSVFEAVYHAVKSALLKTNYTKEMDIKTKFQNENMFKLPETEAKTQLPVVEVKTENIKINTENKSIFEDRKPAVIKSYNEILINEEQNRNYRLNDSIYDNQNTKIDINIFVEDDETAENNDTENTTKEIKPIINVVQEDIKPLIKEEEKVTYIGEVFSTYIIVEKNNSEIIFIDKHALHERIIFEKLKTCKDTLVQYLLIPQSVTLAKIEYDVIINNIQTLYNLGFEVEELGVGNIIVRSAPSYFENEDIKNVIIEIATSLLENKKDISTSFMDEIYHKVPCKAAIKAGDINTKEELLALWDKLKDDENLTHCAHGRPTSVIMTKRELEKQFGRI